MRYELLRVLRNRRFFLLSLGFPLVLYYLIAGPNHNNENLAGSGISAPVYYMLGMTAFGTMSAMLSCGGRIAAERDVGWNRQLRITPLSPRAYITAKVLTAYVMAGLSIAALYIAGATLGVSIGTERWFAMTGLILIALIPFAPLGIAIGHHIKADAIGPAIGGSISLLAFLGGTWFPISGDGVLHHVAEQLPSYWLVQASHVGLGGHAWPVQAWLVIAAWTAVLSVIAVRAYRRDTGRA
jgi:ABC-2 type transport system permease protein